MKPTNEVKIVFDSKSINESLARGVVSAFVAQLDPTIEELADIKTAVSEAVTNCVVHAYPNQIGKVYITARIYGDDRVVILIKDKGVGIPDISQAMQAGFTTGAEDRAGMGFAVMQAFCSGVKLRSVLGKGTTVTLEKRIAKQRPIYNR